METAQFPGIFNSSAIKSPIRETQWSAQKRITKPDNSTLVLSLSQQHPEEDIRDVQKKQSDIMCDNIDKSIRELIIKLQERFE